ncbi:MAG: hypothetical protein AAGA90_15310 [Actinomycetota bacterium]
MTWTTTLRHRIAVALVATMAVAMTGVQPSAADDHELTDEILETLGTSAEELTGLEPNPSWNGLGLFSEDAARLLGFAEADVTATPYAFGDDPTTAPVITPPGSLVTAFGVTMVHVPAEWETPQRGINGDVAFAATPSFSPGSDVVLLWTRFDSEVDFSQPLSFNEGVTMAIPGLPVWESSFAGDTWEGANIIPVAVVEQGVIDFRVNRFVPPQAFQDTGMPAFYYRSGDIMAVAVDAASIEALVDEGRNADATAGTGSEGRSQTLLYTGDAEDAKTHFPGDFFTDLLFGFHLHTTDGPLYVPGFVQRIIATTLAAMNFVVNVNTVLGLDPPPTIDELEEELLEAEEEGAIDDVIEEVEESADEVVDDVEAAQPDPDGGDGDGGVEGDGDGDSGPAVLVVVVIVILGGGVLLLVFVVRRRRRGEALGET